MAGFSAVSEKDEIMDTFGHKLPDPVWLRSNTGKQNGDLKFIQHPNKDVSAHTWSAEHFEWVELGHYSCARKTFEGKIMTSEFLQYIRASKGRRPSLAYFTELVKEYPRYSEARPAVVMPPLSSMHPTNIAQQHPAPPSTLTTPQTPRYDSSSTNTMYHENDFPTLSSLTLREFSKPISRQPAATGRPAMALQGLGAPADDPFAAEASISPVTEISFVKPSEDLRKHTVQRDPGKMNFDFRFPWGTSVGPHFEDATDTGEKDRRAFFAEQERSRAEKMRQSFAPTNRSDMAIERQPKAEDASLPHMLNMIPRITTVQAAPETNAMPCSKSTIRPGSVTSATSTTKISAVPLGRFPDQSDQQLNESRARMRDYLERVSNEQASAMQASKGQPRLQPSGLQLPEPADKNIPASNQMVMYDKPTSSGSQVSRSALRTSDPEPGYYENRHANIYNSLDIVGPTPQNFNGPFFQDDAPTQANPMALRSTRKLRGEDLDEWWKSGTLTERHDAFMKSLIIPTNSGGRNDNKEFIVTDRVLVPLYETLASYVRLPGEPPKAPEYFARFVLPPEWAIDRSRDGDKSFFGEDWGETPRRIGRDPRFKPALGQFRYTLFEEPREEQPVIRFPPEMRGSPCGSNYTSGSNYPSGSSYLSASNFASGTNFALGSNFSSGSNYPSSANYTTSGSSYPASFFMPSKY